MVSAGIFAALFEQAATVTWVALLVLTAVYLTLFGYWCRLVCELLREWAAREREDDERD